MPQYTNHLIHETSPYLLQHAHNPVEWFAWNETALQKAREEDKPILVSIGYSACHWCHVMEKESFEDEATAALMNENFINIKIDREERPDLDHIYMDAVQAITGSGGWPLNVFLTPELKPFFGGTYFPPVKAFNRSSWKEVLTAVARSYKEKKTAITEQAQNLTQHLINVNVFDSPTPNNEDLSDSLLMDIANSFIQSADKVWGGFGSAPKFPQSFALLFLLRHYYFTNNENALQQAVLSLDKMAMGGIYDHIGGGFCRYSTDHRWQIPHFEKMLYDNALLIDAYTEAYQITKSENYKSVVYSTIEFIERELTSEQGGFYSALDADSEGEEGKYYVWSKAEIDEVLGGQSDLFCYVFNISEEGNWEHRNIVWMPEPLEKATEIFKMSVEQITAQLNKDKELLLKARNKRIRPLLDDKILLGWNCLLIKSLCKAYAAFGENRFLQMAEKNMLFIENHLRTKDDLFYHSWNKKVNLQPAFLDDYAFLIQAYIQLQQVTGNLMYLEQAKYVTEKVLIEFSDEEKLLFYFTSKKQKDILVRKKEIYDGATPSGNAVMMENLTYLSVVFDVPEWKIRALKGMQLLINLIKKYPLSFGYSCINLQSAVRGFPEIAIIGKQYKQALKQVLGKYIPYKILQSANAALNNWPLLNGKQESDEYYIYICKNYSCLQPVTNIQDFEKNFSEEFLTKNPHQ